MLNGLAGALAGKITGGGRASDLLKKRSVSIGQGSIGVNVGTTAGFDGPSPTGGTPRTGGAPTAAPTPTGGGFDPNQDLVKGQAEFDRRVAAGEFDPTTPTTPTAPSSPAIVGETEQISQGTEGIRDDRKLVKAEADDALAGLDAVQGLAQTDLRGRLADLDKLVEESRTLSETDLTDIERAGTTAGAAFDPLIAEARESKRQGLAKAVVGTGERGGFESTQFAGQAALTPIEEGTFVGAGGELSKIKGQLDLNIQKLQVAKQQAIESARAAASMAKRTGKREDAALAANLLDKARQVFDAEQNAVERRIDIAGKLQDMRQAAVSFNQDVQDRTLSDIEKLVAVGGDIPDELRGQVEEVMGEGFVDKFASASKAASEAQNEQDEVAAAKEVIDILAKLPEGRTITLKGTVYEGVKSVNPQTQIFKSLDASGQEVFITLDKRTGDIIGTAQGVQTGKFAHGAEDGGGEGETFEQFVDRKQNAENLTFNLGDPNVESDLRAEFEASQPGEFLSQLEATSAQKRSIQAKNLDPNDPQNLADLLNKSGAFAKGDGGEPVSFFSEED